MTLNGCLLFIFESEFMVVGQWEDKGLSWLIFNLFPILNTLPSEWSIPTDYLIELSLDNCQGVGNAVTFLMEFTSFKIILRGSVQQLDALYFLGVKKCH